MTWRWDRGAPLALIGVLVLSPDTLFMRWSGMDGFQMLAWRGLLMGAVLLAVWTFTAERKERARLASLVALPALVVTFCHFANSTLFSLGIANAPVLMVLLGVSAVPVFASIFAYLFLGESTRRATWVATAGVLAGIAIAVTGKDASGVGLNPASVTGALCGLGAAIGMSLSFVAIRRSHAIPIMPAIGLGALMSGMLGLAVTGPGTVAEGNIWAIAVTGIVILPFSFFALSTASRHTHATNVSLILLLETVLGPIWVWAGTGEEPTTQMLAGAALVLVTLALYLMHGTRRRESHA